VNVPAATPTGLPVVNQALEPSWVRHGSATVQRDYQSALTFEQTLVEQLSQTMSSASTEGESSGEGEAGEGGASGALSSQLPQALSAGIMSAGGLGLAAQLTRGLEGIGAMKAGSAAGAIPSGGGSSAASSSAAAATTAPAAPAAAVSPLSGGTGAESAGVLGT
jgi:Rod binding domain-containing protein